MESTLISQIKQMNTQVLAFIGDAVYSLYIRKHFALENKVLAGKLHLKCNQFVKASAQSVALERIVDLLSDDEFDIVKRGRNLKTNNIAHNSSVADYKKATAFEALIGYLYLTEQIQRMLELLKIASDNFREGK